MNQDAPRTQAPRRLTRSSRERMWAGVAGGLGEYFDVDPVIVRLIWMAATVLTGGLAIPLYIAMWIIMPREDQVDPARPYDGLRDGPRQFAAEARQVADDVAGTVRTARHAESATSGARDGSRVGAGLLGPMAGTGGPPGTPVATPLPLPAATGPAASPYTMKEQELRGGRGRSTARRQRTAGALLVVVGALLLFGNTGALRGIPWHLVWPLVVVVVGVALLVRGRGPGW